MFNISSNFSGISKGAVQTLVGDMSFYPYAQAPIWDESSLYKANFFPSKGAGVNRNLAHLTPDQRSNYKKEMIDALSQYNWSYFITLTFMHDVSGEMEVSTIINRFVGKLSSAAYGSRSKKRVRIAAVLERFDSGRIHIHLLMEDVVSRIVNQGKRNNFNVRHEVAKAWNNCHYKTTSPSRAGSHKGAWFQQVYDAPAVLDYMTKDVRNGSDPILHEELSLRGRRFM